MGEKNSEIKKVSLTDAIKNINSNKYILPPFQRDFVWSREQIENLFNSIYCGHPFGSLLFWKINVKKGAKNPPLMKEFFYKFIQNFKKGFKDISHYRSNLLRGEDYWVVLDGQQRLTSLNIGLLGSYKEIKYNKEREFHLYMRIDTSEDIKNPFKFINKDYSHSDTFFIDEKSEQKWLRVKDIYEDNLIGLKKDNKDVILTLDEEEKIDNFKKKLDNLKIVFFELENFEYDEATDIFVKVNSLGTVLEISDILNSITISSWKTINSKEQFKELESFVEKHGFKINTNYIVKAINFLWHNEVRFQIQGFTNFISTIEDKWEDIKEAIKDTFKLMEFFGHNKDTLGGYHVTLPVLYYLYHKSIKNPNTSVSFEKDRNSIKRWINSAIILKIFSSSSSDTILSNIRKVFTERTTREECQNNGKTFLYSSSSLKYVSLKENIAEFPAEELKKALDEDWIITDEYLQKLLVETKKGSRYSLPILSLLYPNYNMNIDFEQDHLHCINHYDKLANEFKDDKDNEKLYDSIVNLQLLTKSDNTSKGDKELKKWIEEQTKEYSVTEKNEFLDKHLIPQDVSFDEKDVEVFFKKRKELLVKKLKEVLM